MFFSPCITKLFDEELSKQECFEIAENDVLIRPGFWSIYIHTVHGGINTYMCHFTSLTSLRNIYMNNIEKDVDIVFPVDCCHKGECKFKVNGYQLYVNVFKLKPNDNTDKCFQILNNLKNQGGF